MARRKVKRLGSWIGAIAMAGMPCLAAAQDAVGPQDLTRDIKDPFDALAGLWQVDRIELDAPSNPLRGRVLRIDRQSVATLTLGTCTNPSFTETLGSVAVSCLGQELASAAWSPDQPGTMVWSEGRLKAVLRRISGTEALDTPPPAEGELPEGEEGSEEAE